MKLAVLLMLFLAGCAHGAPTSQTVADVHAGIQLALCVLDGYSADVQAGMTPAAMTADLDIKCGADAATIVELLDAQARAQAATNLAAARARHP